MSTEEVSQASPPSSSAPSPPSWWRSLVASLPATALALSAIWVIGRPLGQALPGLIREAAKTREWAAWAAVVADLVALGLLVAPVPTLALVRSLLGRVPLLGKR